MNKPPILEVIAKRVELRRQGRRWWGLCPFHSEKTPSFTVSESRQAFYCFGCHAKGDVIAFIQRIDGLSFGDAIGRLGISRGRWKPQARGITRRHRAAALLAEWMNSQHLKVAVLLRELSHEISLAEQIPDTELVESLQDEWEILSVFHDDLQRPEYAAELWAAKDSIEAITDVTPLESVDEFPPCTPEYRQVLVSHLPMVEQAC